VSLISFSPRVAQAIAEHQPVVALESSVFAQGLPIPTNADAARRMIGAIERVGAVPAISAVSAGKAVFGLSDDELARFLARDGVMKVSARDIPVAMLQGRDGATTVAGALSLMALSPIRVFATGGIGGVHREPQFDESADLAELSRTPGIVVCAGQSRSSTFTQPWNDSSRSAWSWSDIGRRRCRDSSSRTPASHFRRPSRQWTR